MTRDHLLGFPALLRQHDEPAAPKKPTVTARPAVFVAFETGVWAPKVGVVDRRAPAKFGGVLAPRTVVMGVDPGRAPGGDKTSTMTWGINGPIWDRKWSVPWAELFKTETREGPKKDAEQAAFENWCDKTRPSGDVESVQRQWVESDERAELFEAETREVTFTDVRNAYRRVRHELGGAAARTLRREFGVDLCLELKPEQWAEFIATAERRLAGWVKWSGGKQPVADLQMVEIRFRAWPETKGYAGNLGPWWWHREESNRFADIVEYRVVVEAKQADGWIKWSGGACPVAGGVAVEVRYGEGTKDCGPAGNWDWRHHGDASGDIVEYRVIK